MLRLLTACIAVAFILGTDFARAQTKWALVIGNDAYLNVDRLQKATNDARALAAALQRVGFTGMVRLLGVIALLLGSPALGLGAQKDSTSAVPFPIASVHFEQNATDGDAEVVFKVKGGKEGLVKLTVVSPDGRRVIDFTAPDASTLGIRQFHFETPEPRDIKSLQAAYPEGIYVLSAATASGDRFRGQAALKHTLPPTASFLWPNLGARDVSATNLKIAWTPVVNLSAYIITIKAPKLGRSLEATLPTSTAVFSVPDGFLIPSTDYKLAIGTVSVEGNVSFAETTFTTGP